MNELSDSRRSILTELRLHGGMSADALVAATGLSKTAARAHLLRMERDGAVERTSQPDGPGRPPAVFSLTDLGASMFPSEDEGLLHDLLRFLEANDAKHLIRAFFEKLWSERASELRATLGVDSVGDASLDARLGAVEASLAEKHFLPVIDREPQGDGSELVTVRECNCPFPAAALASRAPCRLEIDFLSEAIGSRPRSVSIASSRKECCTFEFVVNASPEARSAASKKSP